MTSGGLGQRPVNGTALVLVGLGAGLVLLAVREFDWYSVDSAAADTSGEVTFDSLRASVRQLGGAGVATAYFDWLAVTLLVAVLVFGWLSAVRWAGADPLRVAGFACGFAGVGATWYALRQHFNATGSAHDVFFHATWGVYAALAGYALTAVGSVLGPRSD